MSSPTDRGVASYQVLKRCDELAQISDEPDCITRSFLSPAMDETMTRVAGWMQQAGLSTELDGVGNLIGTRSSGLDDAPVLVLGSHLDTVRDAGRYDGVLGVLLAVAATEHLSAGSLPFDLEVVAFSDEEGLRFGAPFLGSRGLIGALDPELLALCDGDGITMADAIRRWGGEPTALGDRYTGRDVLGYLEAHIEQGPCLEAEDRPLGILEALSGACWLRLRFEGRADHAGTTPMDLRRDPMPAAAEIVLAAERLARSIDGMVATVGRLNATPGASNVVAAAVEFSLDIRHSDGRSLAAVVDEIVESSGEIAERRGLRFEHEVLHRQDAVAADPRLSMLLTEAAEGRGIETDTLVVGAGHDALIMARRMPIAMLLLRTPHGISHHPDEAVLPDDVDAAFRVMVDFVQRLARLETASRATEGRDTDWEPLGEPLPTTDHPSEAER
ncbi:MAG: allantoate amidohydrolase [Acidobacteriota bacterium]